MRLKKPIRALIDQVRITCDGNDAIIDYADREISSTRLTIGPQIKSMTDREIVDVFSGVIKAQELLGPNGIRPSSRCRPASDKSNITRKVASGAAR